MKVIKFENEKQIITIPLLKIAENRAMLYMELEGFSKESKEYKEEIDFVMDDDFEGIDWLNNNMDKEEWQLFAKIVDKETKPITNDTLENSEVNIVEVDN